MIEKQQDGLFCTFLSSIQNGCGSFKRISDLFLFFFLSTYSTKQRYINYCKDSPVKAAETTHPLIYLKLLHSPKLILQNVKKLLFLLGMCGQCVNCNFISYQKVHFFYKQLGSGLSPQSCLYCCLMVAQQCLVVLSSTFQYSKSIFMICDFKIFLIMLLRQLSFGILSVNSFFTFITKEILHFSLIFSFYYCLVRFRLLGYSQVKFDLILHPKVYFGQIWSQKLKFAKLTKIWYRGTLLYAYSSFNVYFFKIIFNHIFSANLVPKSEVFQID